jgi:hypothetical protein
MKGEGGIVEWGGGGFNQVRGGTVCLNQQKEQCGQ